MLKSTFLHLQGIGKKRERELWQQGITTWEQQLPLFDSSESDHILLDSFNALEAGDSSYFSNRLSPADYYRIALTYPEETLFLDIETTGLSLYYDQLTIVGWSIGKEYGVYIIGQDEQPLRSVLEKAKVIVTFNGTIFDLKFLHKTFKDLYIPLVHIDLRFFSKRVGLTGGQKPIEKEIGFKRAKKLEEMLGESAPILWHKYRRGDIKALKKLIEYNHADVEGMKYILDESIKRTYLQEDVPKDIRVNTNFSKNKSKITWAKNRSSRNADEILLEEFSGRVKPLITYSDLNAIHPIDNICVIGIDLVSSEDRESGYCVLRGNGAKTLRLKTDDEMIKLAIENKADLISIDSPLSIPKGRTSYFDDDPHREEFGITRLCERILKKRGINSYPCLIQSMQKLTQRGVELATKFRKIGIPAIESYPGAAQDIMSIPRKQAGLKYLTDGLIEFGINGDFVSEQITHDELDAITSSIVGHFYWTGMFEGLGNEEEGYLIIPDLNADTNVWLNRKVIGLSGEIASGKTTVANYLKSKGYRDTRYSKVLEGILISEGIEVNRKSLQEIGKRVHDDFGQRWLGLQVAETIKGTKYSVVDGIRFLEDYSLIRELFGPGYVHIHIKTENDIQADRVSKREKDNISLMLAKTSKTESEIALLENHADLVIMNL